MSPGKLKIDQHLESLRVRPGEKPKLAKYDTRDTFGWEKEAAKAELLAVVDEIDQLQQRLYAEAKRSLLFVIQAMDAAGKDGTIRAVTAGLNPAGVNVSSFKVPGGPETQHDYLWRIHAACPPKGEIGIFNRSHYEDVLVVRVKNLVPADRWQKRYQQIADFERMLGDEGTRVVKVFLNVSKDEQRQRFQDRLDDPDKRWKFRAGDLDDRKLWPDYMRAYEAALSRTSTTAAPWYVIPADRNWVRNLLVARLLRDTLRDMDPQFPEPEIGTEQITIT